MNIKDIKNNILSGSADAVFASLYPADRLESQRERYIKVIDAFSAIYGDEGEVSLYSVPGRTELGGNHTDHNRGRVIAASVDLDMIAVVRPRSGRTIDIMSEGFERISIDVDACREPREDMIGSTAGLVAGVCSGFEKAGYTVSGFEAYITSDVLRGSGLSSSAAFEVMIGNILDGEFNGGSVGSVRISTIAQYAENRFFGKPCGLMDQVACATGGVVSIDFENEQEPLIERMELDLLRHGYDLCIVDTGGSHADLGADYAAIPDEMRSVAALFGRNVLRECSLESIIASAGKIRSALGDRALMRAIHFFDENERVDMMKDALRAYDIDSYLRAVSASGRSSFCYLQNVYSPSNVGEQGISLALCLTERFLRTRSGAVRVHGGGFAGTVQAYIRHEELSDYQTMIESVFGEGACLVLHIRSAGGTRVVLG